MNEIKNQIKILLKEDTTVFLENVNITGEITNFLISEENIRKIYLIKYDNKIFEQVIKYIKNKKIIKSDALKIQDFNSKGNIYCLNNSNSFNPNFSLIANQKKIKALCLLGFPESSLTINIRSNSCKVIYKPISELFLGDKTSLAINEQIDTNKTRSCRNRAAEKNVLDLFLASPNERLLIIHGFPGIGKNNLLDELKRKAPNREYYNFNFENKSDTYKDIINELSSGFNLSYTEDELAKTAISERNQRNIVNNFFKVFNNKENATLVFESFHKIILADNNNLSLFVSNELKLFFELLITHLDFKSSNKILFLSRTPIRLNDEIRNYSKEIKVRELESTIIKRIMADEYIRINRPDLSVYIGTYNDDEKINEAICGHPALALRFVDASLNHGLDELLNNNGFRAQIGYELKIKWLLDNYPLHENEKKYLEILSLFTSELPDDFMGNYFTDAHSTLDALINRYLVEIRFYKDGTSKYFIPNLIRDYIKGITKPEILKKNHSLIAQYFWDKAEDIKVTSRLKAVFYRKAFYHFSESGDHEKLKLLVIRYRDKFIIEAMESSRQKMWKEAYFYFNELHTHNLIGLDNPIQYNQFLKVLSRISPKPNNAEDLIVEIHNMFPDDSYIAVSYADYLFDKNDKISLQKAIEECYRIKKVLMIPGQKGRGFTILDKAIVDNTLAKCLYKANKKDIASQLVQEWMIFFDKRGNTLSDKEKYHYQAILMTEYKGLDDFETYLAAKNEVLQLIKNEAGYLPAISFFELGQIHCINGNESEMIEKQFNKILSFNHDTEKINFARDTFRKNIINEQDFLIEIKKYPNQLYFVNQMIKDKISFIQEFISKGKTLLSKIKSISHKNNFPAEYAMVGLMEVEADFNILKIFLNNFYKSV